MSDANSARVIESSRNPLVEEISAAEVLPITVTPGNASWTAATTEGPKLSNALNRMPAWGFNPASEARH